MFGEGGPVKRPDGDGVVVGGSDAEEVEPVIEHNKFPPLTPAGRAQGGFPTPAGLKIPDRKEDELLDWLGDDLVGKPTDTVEVVNEPVKDTSRRVSGWNLQVDNRKADLAYTFSATGYRVSVVMLSVLVVLKFASLFGFLEPLGLEFQVIVMVSMLTVTFVCGFTALGLLLRKDVSVRGERFVKKVVHYSVISLLLMNSLMFLLLFSDFHVPDFDALFDAGVAEVEQVL